MHYRGDFTVLYMPHLAEEAEIMLNNLIPFLQHKYSNEVSLYFTKTAKMKLKMIGRTQTIIWLFVL